MVSNQRSRDRAPVDCVVLRDRKCVVICRLEEQYSIEICAASVFAFPRFLRPLNPAAFLFLLIEFAGIKIVYQQVL